MSNFQCPQCGMVNIDCGKEGYKTPKELEYEKTLEEIEEHQKRNCEVCSLAETKKCDIHCQVFVILNIISKTKGEK